MDSADEWQWSFSLGAMIELQEGTRLGINYFSEVENDDLGGDIETTLPGPLPGFSDRVNIEFTLPQGAVASLRQEITDDLVLFFDLGWADFSSLSAISVDVSGGTTVNANIHFRDITFGGIGGDYRINDLWTWQFGAQYASSPVGGSDRNPALAFRSAGPLRHGSPLRVEREPHARPLVRVRGLGQQQRQCSGLWRHAEGRLRPQPRALHRPHRPPQILTHHGAAGLPPA